MIFGKLKDNDLNINIIKDNNISGLNIHLGFINIEEIIYLKSIINSIGWNLYKYKYVQYYGFKYNYDRKDYNFSDYLGEIPDTLNVLKDLGLNFNQLSIFNLKKGQGIVNHKESDLFDNVTVLLPLDDLILNIEDNKEIEYKLLIKKGTLIVIDEIFKKRYDYKYGISRSKVEIFNDRKIILDDRIVMIFRNIKFY